MAVIYIGTAADLAKIGNDPAFPKEGEYEQTADIDLNTPDTNPWPPICGKTAVPTSFFAGKYDGKGFEISNMTVNNPGTKCSGLFGAIGRGAELSNIKIINGQVSGTSSSYVGAVCGYNYSGSIQSCSTDSTTDVSSEVSDYVGGICGYSYGGAGAQTAAISACVNHGSVSGGKSTGGVCGFNRGTSSGIQGQITACYNTGAVTGPSEVGGVCGHDDDMNSPISACYNIGAVSVVSGGYAGGVCGWERTRDTIVDCYWADGTGPTYGIGFVDQTGSGSDDGAVIFSTDDWPEDDAGINWGIGNDPGNGEYWKDLGEYPAPYPTLWWE